MSTLSQFFNNDAVSGSGVTTFIGSSRSLTIPSTSKYVGYGVIGAGGSSFCYTQSCWDPGNNGTGNSGGGFSWWEGPTTYGTPTNLTITVGTTTFQANGGSTCITGGPQAIYATGGCICMGGCGVGGLINTKGGINGCSLTRTCCISGCCCGACWKGAASSGGGAGGLLGCGGRGCLNSSTWGCSGGGGYGSGGGAGWPSGDGGYTFGTTAQVSDSVVGPLNHIGSGFGNNMAYNIGYNCSGQVSQAKTYLSAQGTGASCSTPAAQGGGGTTYAAAGFGGGAGASVGCWWACTGQPGCGGGGGFAQYSSCCCGCCACVNWGCGGNGFAIVEYWNR